MTQHKRKTNDTLDSDGADGGWCTVHRCAAARGDVGGCVRGDGAAVSVDTGEDQTTCADAGSPWLRGNCFNAQPDWVGNIALPDCS